ncbi:Ceramide synthase 1 [Sparganum proliferum]
MGLNQLILATVLRRAKFRECDVQKFPECFFRSIYYVCITCYGLQTIYLSGKHVFFQEPCAGFDLNPDLDQYFSQQIPTDLLILYWVQFSYYLANVYMVQFLDTVKKDTGLMMIHHIVTLLLIGFSYLARYVKVGCVVYLLHDVSDAILESGKLLIYYNGRENKRHPWGELISTSMFVAFTCSWFYLRVYLFPLHLLHAANWCTYLRRDFMMLKFYLLFNFLLVALFTMHLVWGWFILRMAFRLVMGQSSRLEDIREEEESNGHVLKDKKA